jgi:hypothetical protein
MRQMRRVATPVFAATLVLAAALGVSSPVRAQPTPLQDRVKILTEIVNAIGAAGEAIAKLANGISAAVAKGAEGVDAIVARLDRSDMRALLARTAGLEGEQRTLVIVALEEYVGARRAGRPGDWAGTQKNMSDVLTTVDALIPDVKSIRNDFVNEPAYAQLIQVLTGRRSVLMQLMELSEPQSEEELKLVERAAEKYGELHRELARLNAAIREYNKGKRGGGG